ncbi:MAG: hypothetical protein AAFW84_27130 [Cyanobacteria bacterium J06635_15]
MDQWEFLLQQEGDRTWLPLESSTAEILEGRYRVMAHSSYISTAVEIRISHILPDQMPPKRRVHKRHHQTNPEGLIVVMPFTHLRPGAWELRCIGGDLMEDILGEGWQYSVQLQVLSQSREEDPADWDDRGSEQGGVAAAPETIPEASRQSADVVDTEPVANPFESPVDDLSPLSTVHQDLSPVLAEDQANHHRDSVVPTDLDPVESEVAPTESICLQLQQTAYVLPNGRLFTLAGQFKHPFSRVEHEEGAEQGETEQGIDTSPLSLCLHVYLRDPQTAELIKQVQHPLTDDPNQAFEVEIHLPDALDTRLVLGEVMVQSSLEVQQSYIWATQAFTVTIALNELLDVIADQAEAQDDSDVDSVVMPLLPTEAADSVLLPAASAPSKNKSVKLTLPVGDLPSLEAQSSLLPALGWIMPPQIYQSELGDAETASLALPPLPSKTTPATTRPTATNSQPLASHDPLPEMGNSGGDLRSKSLELPGFARKRSPQSPQPDQSSDDAPDLSNSQESGQDSFDPNALVDVDEALSPTSEALTHGDLDAEYPIDPLPSEPVAAANPVFRSIDDDLDAALVAQEADPHLWDEPPLDRAFAFVDDAELSDTELSADTDQYLLLDNDLTAESDTALDSNLPETPHTPTETKAQVESSFQALNLQTRFWDRLNAFAIEGYQASHELRSAMAASEVVVPPEQSPAVDPLPLDDAAPLHTSPSLDTDNGMDYGEASFADEVVIYEDTPAIAGLPDALLPDEVQPSFTDRDDQWMIPQPQVFLPDGDFKAGQQLPIRIVLPDSDQRLYVKLWVSDRQTRTLVDEPRWLMYLEPNGQGSVETTLRVTVPMHCLEIQVAAIAVDMPTQRESERVICNRRVTPADLPSLSLDEFDV